MGLKLPADNWLIVGDFFASCSTSKHQQVKAYLDYGQNHAQVLYCMTLKAELISWKSYQFLLSLYIMIFMKYLNLF